jgi:hypothetical protein
VKSVVAVGPFEHAVVMVAVFCSHISSDCSSAVFEKEIDGPVVPAAVVVAVFGAVGLNGDSNCVYTPCVAKDCSFG